MPKEMPLAQDLMTTEVVTVRPDLPVTTLARLLADRGISSAPVTDATGLLLGIVTEADLLRRLAGNEDAQVGWLQRLFGDTDRQAKQYARTHGMTARDVMTGDLVTVGPADTAARCAQAMEKHHIKRLPVVTDGRLLGVISRSDLLHAILEPPAPLGTSDSLSPDARIRVALKAELREQPWANSMYIFPEVENGVVTLHGFFRSEEVRRALRVMAGRIEGVQRVEDHMEKAPMVLVGDLA
jgi:CBS domain-containing protein